jgi:hypothetical protein
VAIPSFSPVAASVTVTATGSTASCTVRKGSTQQAADLEGPALDS